MTIEIWSDIVCPFCYLGKRKLEKALNGFEHRDSIKLVYKSFQLMPHIKTEPGLSINEFLAREKGMSLEQARQMNAYVTEQAAAMGLVFSLDHAIVANTFQAHRLLHYAKSEEKQAETKERLLKAYFSEGKNIDDRHTLVQLAKDIGLTNPEKVLASDEFALDVREDVQESRRFGVKGVPFFIFDRKYAISGAQEVDVFTNTLEQTFRNGKGNNTG